jgi:hypothetical protein
MWGSQKIISWNFGLETTLEKKTIEDNKLSDAHIICKQYWTFHSWNFGLEMTLQKKTIEDNKPSDAHIICKQYWTISLCNVKRQS